MRKKIDDQKLENSLRNLKKVIINSEEEFLYLKGKTSLSIVFSIVSNAMGFKMDPTSEVESTIDEICKTSRIRYRTIKLQEKWWEKDCGHFISHYKSKPVAVIFKYSNYYIFSPEDQKKILVNEEINKDLQSKGIVLYTPTTEKEGRFQAFLNVFFKKKFKDYLFLIIAGILTSLLGFVFPFANKVLFDRIVPNFDFILYYQVILGLIVGIISVSIFSFARSIFSLRLNGNISHDLQMHLWDRLLKLPVKFFRKFQTGDLIQRTLIFSQLSRAISQSTLITLFDSFFSIFYLAVMLFFSWQLALIGFVVIGISFLIYICIASFKIKWDMKIIESNAVINSFLIQMIEGIEKIRVAGIEKRFFALWGKYFAENQSFILKSKFLKSMIVTLNSAIKIILIILLFGIVIWMRSSENSLTIGDYLAFSAAFFAFSSAFFQLSDLGIRLISLIPFAQRIHPLIFSPVEKTEDQLKPEIFKGEIKISNLFFRYSSKVPFAIKYLNLSIEGGKFVSLVGRTGCGKSTLCRLLIGFEKQDKGSIYFDNHDLNELDISEVRHQVNAIINEKAIFSGTMLENMICGQRYSQEEIERAIQLSTFERELRRFPAGLRTLLPSGGLLLSGGERQKLLLTRALLKNPKILIIDEGLNSLDGKSQTQIIQNLKNLPMTILMVTHQRSILKEMDYIFMMEGGTITASGHYEELLEKEQSFRELIQAV